ncbi:MAG: hypothetical protein LBI05_01325 [Planctomycetaceae bacterium]|jgi:hypothetical protein|nr:hypothetical protein [Planctomycetaceae bacterium]
MYYILVNGETESFYRSSSDLGTRFPLLRNVRIFGIDRKIKMFDIAVFPVKTHSNRANVPDETKLYRYYRIDCFSPQVKKNAIYRYNRKNRNDRQNGNKLPKLPNPSQNVAQERGA